MPTTSNWGDHHAVAAFLARGLDEGESLLGGGVAGLHHQALGRADLEDRARLRQHRPALVNHAEPGRRGAVPAHVVVRVEGGKPDHPAVAALHAPHPLDRLGIEPAHRAVEGDAAEDLDARDVLAHEPRAVRSVGDVVLEHDRFHLPRGGQRGQLVVVDRAAEDVGGGVGVEVDQALDRAHRRRGRGVALHAGVGGGPRRRPGGSPVR
jgi:hypothetical protein